jgi:hypothetical protein
MKKTFLFSTLAIVAMTITFSTTSCKKDDDSPAPVVLTLYDSLGGTALKQDPKAAAGVMIETGRLGIRSVVDSTIFVIAADSRISPYFSKLLMEVGAGNLSGFTLLSKTLTDFLCVGTGAKNFTYTGLSMTAAHNPATNTRMNGKADNAAMDAFIGDVVVGANKNALPTYLIARVGAVLESLRTQVVQR